MNNIQWYPGHMTKTRRMMEENISLVDIVIELVDARIPYSSKNPDLDTLAKNKHRILLLNKCDLADERATDIWQEYFEKQGFRVIRINALKGNGLGEVTETAHGLMKEKIEKLKARGRINVPIRSMIVGIPNVGKSTFIKRFMDEMVLPYMEDEHARMRAQDELPQSAGGKTITTTEPKFIPNEAAKVRLNDDIEVSVRLIDCVGYMIDGAAGHMEEDAERMVKTPWSEEEIPFTQAAEIGTDKVMRDHSTIGLVITTDGSIGELPRSNYLGAEEKTILALKKSGKPFLVLVNSQKPYSEETRQVAEEIGKKYDVAVMPVNCEQLKKEDINRLLEKILYEFPLTAVEFYFPKWMDMLPVDHAVKQDLLRQIRELMNSYDRIRDVAGHPVELQGDYIQSCKMEPVQLWNGIVPVQVGIDDRYYYEMLSGMLGENVEDEYQLLNKLKELAEMKKEYTKVQDALSMVKIKGYGVVTPDREDIALEKPELIRHGNKFGVKIKASSPSIHMIRANIETEIAPIVGTEQQAQDLIQFIDQAEAEHGIWETNIFGKTVEQLVDDGITTKVASIGEESQLKLQDTMQKIVIDSNGGMVCIII